MGNSESVTSFRKVFVILLVNVGAGINFWRRLFIRILILLSPGGIQLME